jgi:hypothetical protein
MRGSIGKEVKLATDDSLNCFAENFFAGLTRVTGTVIDKDKRSEIYDVSLATNSFGRYTTSLTFSSRCGRPSQMKDLNRRLR